MSKSNAGYNRRDLLRSAGAAVTFFIAKSAIGASEENKSEAKLQDPVPYRNDDILYRNEHPLGVSNLLRDQLKSSCASDSFHHYAFLENQTEELKKTLSRRLELPENLLFLAPGAGPTIEKILNTIRIEKSTFAISNPDFYFLIRVAEYMKLKMTKVPVGKDYSVDLEALAKTKADYIYFSNPHVPYGRAKTREEIEKILKSLGKNSILIVDEAYSEFSPRHKDITCIDLTKKYKNLIVIRTFSKIYGLAALRIGYYATQNKKFSEYFTIYTTSAFSAKAAILALDDTKRFSETYEFIQQAKEKIKKAASQSKIQCIESEANFVTLLTKQEQKQAIVKKLEAQNFKFSPLGKGPLLRISLGSPEALEKAIEVVSTL